MKIGSVTLNKDMYWVDEFQHTQTAGTAERTIYGGLVTQNFKTYQGRPLTLQGTQASGWQSRATVQALIALTEDPLAVYEVELPDGSKMNAMFRHEDQPVVSFEQITPASAPGSDFWYYGTVKMRIVT